MELIDIAVGIFVLVVVVQWIFIADFILSVRKNRNDLVGVVQNLEHTSRTLDVIPFNLHVSANSRRDEIKYGDDTWVLYDFHGFGERG